MVEDLVRYCKRRFEEEDRAAKRAHSPEAAMAHFELAGRYREKLKGLQRDQPILIIQT